MWYNLLILCYKPVQHVTVLNTIGNCNTIVSIISYYNIVLKYYNLMGPPSYMRPVLDQNIVMRHIPVLVYFPVFLLCMSVAFLEIAVSYGQRFQRITCTLNDKITSSFACPHMHNVPPLLSSSSSSSS